MYQAFFKLNELPFSLTPDTQFFLNQHSHRAALNTLLVSLKHSEGFIKVVGEVGTGKTMLSRILLSRLGADFVTAYIPNPYLTPEELKGFVAQEIGVAKTDHVPAHELMSSIYRKLASIVRSGKQVVLVVDEAQTMPKETLECLRLLTNLETEKRKLLQVVIIGQPELDVLLARKDLRQLKQRIVFSEYLKPLTVGSCEHYIRHRLEQAGNQNPGLFTRSALKLVARGAGGIPRLVNILCHKAMLCAYGKGHGQITPWHVAQAIADTPESTRLGYFTSWPWRCLGAMHLVPTAEARKWG